MVTCISFIASSRPIALGVDRLISSASSRMPKRPGLRNSNSRSER